jgi:hypothetical protein
MMQNFEMMFTTMLMQQLMLQQQLIMMQQKVIELQQRVDDMTPKNSPDHEVFWHLASGGVMSDEVMQSDDLALVKKFQQWNIDFAKKHIKPYVSPKAYSECLNQMTRGLSDRIAELETKELRERLKKRETPALPFTKIIPNS